MLLRLSFRRRDRPADGGGGDRALDAELRKGGDAEPDQERRLDGAGVGYVRFAMARPARFRLIFSSARPDFGTPELKTAADAAFKTLARDVAALTGADSIRSDATMHDLMIAWSLMHGLADLMNAGRLKPLLSRLMDERDRAMRALLRGAPRMRAPMKG